MSRVPNLIVPPEGYIPPQEGDIIEKLGKDAKDYNISLLKDTASALNGGTFNIGFLDQMGDYYQHIFEKSGGEITIPGTSLKTTDYEVAGKAWAAAAADPTYQFRNFIRKLNPNNIPGDDIIDKARHVLDALSEASGGASAGYPGNWQIPAKYTRNERKVEHALKELSRITSKLDKKLLDMIKTKSMKMLDASLMKRVALYLRGDSQFTLRISGKLKESPEGSDRIYRSMKNPSDLRYAMRKNFALPKAYQMQALISNKMVIKKKANNLADKQLVAILVDASGSMSGHKITLASGVVYERLEAVIKGHVEVYLNLFDSELYRTMIHAHDDESAFTALKYITDPNSYKMGGTDIQGAAEAFIEKLAADERRKELIIITDGEAAIDRVAFSKFLLEHEYKLHIVYIEGGNTQLDLVAYQTGGYVGSIKDFN